MPDKIDSNATGLRFAEELSLKTLPGSPVWYQLEPNSYSDFGGEVTTVARNPINPSRQRKKGVVTDLDASGGFNSDLTFNNLTRLLQGFFFADIREKFNTAPMNAAAIPITSTTTTTYVAASGLGGVLASALLFASGFTNAANNGLKVGGIASTATAITTTGLVVEASPPAGAQVQVVGYQFASATVDISMATNLVRLSRASGTFDFTTLGLIPGEWVYLGGDGAATRFNNNVGFARVRSVAATLIEFDKVQWASPANETGTGKTIQMFFGSILRNESNPALIKRRSYQLERTLGPDPVSGTMSEYLVGAVPNELTINIPQADKVTIDLSFVGLDNEQRTGAQAVKTGTRPTLVTGDAFNTSSDVVRMKLALADPLHSSIGRLFAFATEGSVSINNNVSPAKAIGVLGGFETNTGTFEVSGNVNAYFSDVAAVSAVRNNSDITLDFVLIKGNTAMVIDLPLIALGGGRLQVEQDQAITLPLDTNAAESSFGNTLLIGLFNYLPDLA